MRALLIAGVICIVLSFIGIVAFIWLHVGTGGHVPFDHGIVMDAGSSHTEVLLYKWLADKYNDTGIVEQKGSCGTHVGIDDNGANTNVTIQDLTPCVAEVASKIAAESDDNNEREIPVYMGATAGMRILNATEPHISQLIFVSLENAILRFKSGRNVFNVKTFRIIEGREEALYAWITANYLSGLIPNLGRKHADLTNITSLGILDMGGASAQIAYAVSKEHLVHFEPSEIQTVHLYGHKFDVRGESNLCLGSDEILKRHRVLQIIANRGATKINDPCYNEGVKVEVTGEDLQSVCTVAVSDSDNLVKADQKYEFTGKFDEQKCSQILEESLEPNKCKSKLKHCMVSEKHAPPPETVIYAMSNYFYSTSVLNISETTVEEYSREKLEFCKKNENELQEMNLDKKFAADYCFKLNAIYSILTKLYLFEAKHWTNLRFRNKINGHSLGWALGFMTHETNLIPAESPTDAMITTAVFVFALIVSLLLLAIGIFLILKWKQNSGERNLPASAKEQHALKDHNRNYEC